MKFWIDKETVLITHITGSVDEKYMEILKAKNIDASQWPRWAGGSGVSLQLREVVNGLKVEGEDLITSIRKRDTWSCYSRLTELKLNSTNSTYESTSSPTRKVNAIISDELINDDADIFNEVPEIRAKRNNEMEALHFTAALVFSAALIVFAAAVTSD